MVLKHEMLLPIFPDNSSMYSRLALACTVANRYNCRPIVTLSIDCFAYVIYVLTALVSTTVGFSMRFYRMTFIRFRLRNAHCKRKVSASCI